MIGVRALQQPRKTRGSQTRWDEQQYATCYRMCAIGCCCCLKMGQKEEGESNAPETAGTRFSLDRTGETDRMNESANSLRNNAAMHNATMHRTTVIILLCM